MKLLTIPNEIKNFSREMIKSRDGTTVMEIEKNTEYSLAFGELEKGQKNKHHKMAMQEIYFIIEGKGRFRIDNHELITKKGDLIKITKNSSQQLTNIGKRKLKFFMIVNPPYDSQKEEILD